MAERSLKAELAHLRKGRGEVFVGEGILALANLCSSGVNGGALIIVG